MQICHENCWLLITKHLLNWPGTHVVAMATVDVATFLVLKITVGVLHKHYR